MAAKETKDSGLHRENGNPQKLEKQSTEATLPAKVYTHRNSVLTDLMKVNHLQSVYNINVASCFLLLFNATLYYIVAPHTFFPHLQLISWGAGKVIPFFAMWNLLHVYAFLVHQSFKSWTYVRNKIYKKIADFIFCSLYVISVVLLFAGTAYFTRKYQIPPITGFSILCEQVRIFMKTYSFVRENAPRVLRYDPRKDGNQDQVLVPSLSHYIYFLFIPAFIYRDTYPRTEKIRWNIVFYNLLKMLCTIFINYCIFLWFILKVFPEVGVRPFSLPDAVLILAGCTLVGSLMMFLMFYGLLHCWLNAFAEIMRFGDRQFYQDWWNSTSFSQYYRKWNTVVHDWLYAYIYVDTHRLGFKRSRSMLLVFLVSAFVHEYVISFALGFFYPVLLVMYSTLGVSVMFLTRNRTTQFWNTFMFGMLFSGWGLLVFLYSCEWFARINCPSSTADTIKDFFIPRSLSHSACPIVAMP